MRTEQLGPASKRCCRGSFARIVMYSECGTFQTFQTNVEDPRRGKPHSVGRRFAVLLVQASLKRLRESHTPVARLRDRFTLVRVFPTRSNRNPLNRIGLVAVSALPLLVSYPANAAVVRAMSREMALPSEERALALDLLAQGLPPLTRRAWIPFLFGVSPKIVGAMEVRSERYYRRFRSCPNRS